MCKLSAFYKFAHLTSHTEYEFSRYSSSFRRFSILEAPIHTTYSQPGSLDIARSFRYPMPVRAVPSSTVIRALSQMGMGLSLLIFLIIANALLPPASNVFAPISVAVLPPVVLLRLEKSLANQIVEMLDRLHIDIRSKHQISNLYLR